MNDFDMSSYKLLTEKILEPLTDENNEELKRIEKLDVTSFTEADVREEIINPILKILGYQKGNQYSVDREKSISFLGGKRRSLDYSLKLWEKNFWLVEAKKPRLNKSAFGYADLNQALEYAVHPEINAALIVLCDGVKLEIFDREKSLVHPIVNVVIHDITKHFDEVRKFLAPLHVWFFYKRRVLDSIDRAFEHEFNESRVDEFRRIIESQLQSKRAIILQNFRDRNISDNDEEQQESLFKNASLEEIIEIHFFQPQTEFRIRLMIFRLIEICHKSSDFLVFYKMFPDDPRDTNDYFYMYALEFLIQVDKEGLQVRWLPGWLSENNEINIQKAIKKLIFLCLTHFEDDLGRKSILLAANTYKRIFKVMSVVLPYQETLAKQQHLVTRYMLPELCWAQILSSKERNMLIDLDGLSLQATAAFVREYSTDRGFKENLAAKAIKDMYMLEADLINSTPNYQQLLKEYDFGEICLTEMLGVRYDNLGHSCLCVVKNYSKWESYVLENHVKEVRELSFIGSWAAKEVLVDDSLSVEGKGLLANRFFFGDAKLFDKVSKLYD